MKTKSLLITILAIVLVYFNASATETEPNNNRNTANKLALYGTNNGSISAPGDEDWWKLTTTGDGDLNLRDTVTNTSAFAHQWCTLELYDNDGTTLIYSGYNDVLINPTIPGLAAGTYYIRIHGDYNSNDGTGTIPDYILSNSLNAVSNNDAEPNNIKAEAILLPPNKTKNGHIGYYYNGHKDSTDWYKITIPEDGFLSLSLTNGNGNTFVELYLFDNDGTTLLNNGGNYSGINFSNNGLAAGTYYVRVNTIGNNSIYYPNSGWSTYTLTSSFSATGITNDAEPNDKYKQGINLSLNGTTTGHIGYYYNNKRDSADWYKIVLPEDGYLGFSITPQGNGNNPIQFFLFDNDGTTLLGGAGHYIGPVGFSKDGLAAGTYYLRVNMESAGAFATYSLTNSFSTYANANDTTEPNDVFSQAKTMNANSTATGHVGFYYNNRRDTNDYWKINYTGSGALTLNVNVNNWLSDGQARNFVVHVYDASSNLIYADAYNSTATINLTGLAQAYYWVGIYMQDYNNAFGAYSLSNSFTQTKAKIAVVSYDTTGGCTSTNTITYKCSKSSAPYTVQLYRFGRAYGNAVTVKNSKVTFDNLPAGSYSATVYGDGATGNAKGKSDIISIEPLVTGLNTTNITNTSAKLNWTKVNCAAYYAVEYKKHNVSSWTKKETNGNKNFINVSNLQANTKYDWSVAAIDSQNNIISMGIYADSISFTTASSLIAGNNNEEEDLSVNDKNNIASMFVSPNPAVSFFVIHFNNDKAQKLNAILYDATGKAIWSSGLINTDALNNKQVNVRSYSNGVFYLKIIDENGAVTGSTKVIVSK